MKFLFIYFISIHIKKTWFRDSLTMSSQEQKDVVWMRLSKHFEVTSKEFSFLRDALIQALFNAEKGTHEQLVLLHAVDYVSNSVMADIKNISMATALEFMAGEHGGLNETCVAGRDLSLENYVFIQFGSRSVYIGLNPHHA